jgi:hypothetical protein
MINIVSIHFIMNMSDLGFIGTFSIVCSLLIGILSINNEIRLRFLRKNDWNSIYRN